MVNYVHIHAVNQTRVLLYPLSRMVMSHIITFQKTVAFLWDFVLMGLQTCNVRHRRILYSAPHCSPPPPTTRSSPTAANTPTCWSAKAPENAAPTENGPAQRPNAKVSTRKIFQSHTLSHFSLLWQFSLAFRSCWHRKKKQNHNYLMRFMGEKKVFLS